MGAIHLNAKWQHFILLLPQRLLAWSTVLFAFQLCMLCACPSSKTGFYKQVLGFYKQAAFIYRCFLSSRFDCT